MKLLSERKTRLVFETADQVFDRGRWRQVIFEAQPQKAIVHLKGLRASYPIDYAAVYGLAVKRAVEATRRPRPGS